MLKTGIGAAVPPFRVMDVIAAANARAASLAPGEKPVIRLEAGQPPHGLPAGALAAVEAALHSGDPLGYTETFGRASLRARLQRHIGEWYGLDLPVSRIGVTMAGSGAFPLAFLAAFNTGDTVALAAPYYPPYLNILVALGLKPLLLPCGIETGFQPTVAMLEALPQPPDGLIIASPANPTGAMLAPDDLAALARYCHEAGIRLISDEIYHGLTYGKPIATAASYSPSAIIINSFSKYFSMTGWRIGWMVLPEDLARPAERLAQNFFISAPYIAQVAAEAALDCGAELDARRDAYALGRAAAITGLKRAGYTTFPEPDGAFYIYVRLKDAAEDSTAFAARLLAGQNISVTPGLDFDADQGTHFFRMSYCGALADIEEAMGRLYHFG
jgi:aspartate/methionine/tyrosine aminotransferase